ncbi:hypothetical protein [Staphylococcus epidermidis]
MVRQWLKPSEKVGKTAFTNFILQILLLNLIIRIFSTLIVLHQVNRF